MEWNGMKRNLLLWKCSPMNSKVWQWKIPDDDQFGKYWLEIETAKRDTFCVGVGLPISNNLSGRAAELWRIPQSNSPYPKEHRTSVAKRMRPLLSDLDQKSIQLLQLLRNSQIWIRNQKYLRFGSEISSTFAVAEKGTSCVGSTSKDLISTGKNCFTIFCSNLIKLNHVIKTDFLHIFLFFFISDICFLGFLRIFRASFSNAFPKSRHNQSNFLCFWEKKQLKFNLGTRATLEYNRKA